MDGSGDNPQILQIPVHLPGYTQCFTRILPVFGQNMVFLPSLSSRSIDSEH